MGLKVGISDSHRFWEPAHRPVSRPGSPVEPLDSQRWAAEKPAAGPKHILFAGTDLSTYKFVERILEEHGCKVVLARDGSACLRAWERDSFDLILLETRLADLGGLEVYRRIRQSSAVPIIMITAQDTEAEAIDGFEAGADDYVMKPIRSREFIARLRVAFDRASRRNEPAEEQTGQGELILSQHCQQVFRSGQPVRLSPIEYRLLRYLMHHRGRVIPKEELLREVWGYSNIAGDLNLVETAVKRLRREIEDDPKRPRFLLTVWGTGYRFNC